MSVNFINMVSVIIVAKNAEPFIDKCILALESQTYENFEIVIVVDKSTDETESLIKSFSASFHNIAVYAGRNLGIADARNMGLDNCHGDYFCFVDADDFVEKNYLSSLVDPMITDSAISLTKCSFKQIGGKYETKAPQYLKDGMNTNEQFAKYILLSGEYFPWGFMFRKTNFGALRFETGNKSEDSLFLYDVLIACCYKGILFINSQDYNYVVRSGSASNNGFTKAYIDQTTNIKLRAEKLKLIYPNLTKEIEYRSLLTSFIYVLAATEKEKRTNKEYYKENVHYLKKSRDVFLSNANFSKKWKYLLKLFLIFPGIASIVFKKANSK